MGVIKGKGLGRPDIPFNCPHNLAPRELKAETETSGSRKGVEHTRWHHCIPCSSSFVP